MASRNFHKRRTRERKARQARARRIERLRHRVVQFAGMQPRAVARMTLDELERRVRQGGRVRMTTAMDGLALAIAAMPHAERMFVRDGKPTTFKYL